MTIIMSTDLPTTEQLVDATGWMFPEWAHQCHAVSLAILNTGLMPPGSRVARGAARGVGGQHSWIVVSENGQLADCYAQNALIFDPTLWSYRADVDDIFIGRAPTGHRHAPHGKGPHIMEYGRPSEPVDEIVPLAPEALAQLSATARYWVETMLGPLDRRGWMEVANGTVTGWQEALGEILGAMDDTPELSAFVPVDKLGMLTDRNPGDLFLPKAS